MKNKYLYFIKFLQEVRVSYKKYIGEKSLYLLNCYLNGYCYNIEWKDSILSFEGSDSEIKNTQSLYFDITEIREFFFAFQSWIGQKYLCQWQSWSNIIRFHLWTISYAKADYFVSMNVMIRVSKDLNFPCKLIFPILHHNIYQRCAASP